VQPFLAKLGAAGPDDPVAARAERARSFLERADFARMVTVCPRNSVASPDSAT
jgi:hypothetical protein